MTNQEAYSTVRDHLLAQGRRAAVEADGADGESTLSCRYRAPDGCHCAVGCLIPDPIYDPKMEGHGIRTLLNGDCPFPKLVKHLDGVDQGLLAALQGVHDTHPVVAWPQSLARVAAKFGLVA